MDFAGLNETVHDKYNSSQLNFSKLNPGSRIILALVVSFGGHKVPELIFKRFLDRQFRLSLKGDKTIAELGWANEEPGPNFTKNLMYQLTDNWEFIQTQLLSRPWFKVEEIWDPIRKSYSLLDGVRDLILKQWADQTCRYWHRIAFQLICHVFPRDTTWEPSFQTHGEALAPCLDYIMDYFSGSNLSPHMRLMLAESLVAKAKLGRQYSPDKALEDAKNLLKDDSDAPQYMRAAIDLQRSILE